MKHFKQGILLSLAILLSSCGKNSTASNKKTNTSSQNSQTETIKKKLALEGRDNIGKGEYFTFSVLLDGEKLDSSMVEFTSSDKSILTISSTGIVKGIALGKAIVTAKYKKDNSVKATKEIEVTESMVPDNVIKNFIREKTYTIQTDWNIQSLNNVTSYIQYYQDSIIYKNDTESHGFGNSDDGVFTYEIVNDQIQNPVLLRNYYENYQSMFITLANLSGFSFPKTLSEDNFYPIENNSTLIQSFFLQVAQFESFTTEEIQNVLKSTTRGDFEVISPTEFKVSLYFNDSDYAFLTFRKNDTKNDTRLEEYLKTNHIQKPELLPAIENIYKLSKNHNYYRDLGTFTKRDGTKIPIGKCYYTKNYIYFDYSDEYIEENKDDETFSVTRHGLIELHNNSYDGVYNFEVNKEDGNMEVIVKDKYIDEGRTYDHYYDSYENITLIFDYLQNEMFRFVLNTGDDEAKKTSMFYNDGPLAKYLTTQLFQSILSLGGLTSAGILLTISYDSKNTSNSEVLLGGIFTVSDDSSTQYYNQKYSYTGFNSVKIDYLDCLVNQPNDNTLTSF